VSNHLTSLVYKLDVGSLMRKSTLILLADKASDDGNGIWASKQTMADELCCSRQAVINTLRAFIEEELLVEIGRKVHLNGYTVEYSLNIDKLAALPRVNRWAGDTSTMLTGQRSVRVKRNDGGRQRRLPKPPVTTPPTADERSSAVPPQGGLPLGNDEEEQEEKQEEKQEEEEPQAPRARRGTRLPEDWTPPPIDTLPLTTQAVLKQWPSGAYEFVATGFAAHWTAESGARASKKDWQAAWVKWLSGESARVMAAARTGIRFAAPDTTNPVINAKLAALQDGEDGRSQRIREQLRRDVGDRTYDGWLKQTAITVSGGPVYWSVKVTAASDFAANWLKQHFAATIRALACKLLETDQVAIGIVAVSP
jgi:hypothetical protein